MRRFPDFATLERSPNPNDCLVAPDGLTQAKIDRVAPIFARPPGKLFDDVLARLENASGFRDIEADAQAGEIRAVAVTPILRFKDDFYVKVLPAETGATLAVYSRSRVGVGDMGTNRRRVQALLDHL